MGLKTNFMLVIQEPLIVINNSINYDDNIRGVNTKPRRSDRNLKLKKNRNSAIVFILNKK